MFLPISVFCLRPSSPEIPEDPDALFEALVEILRTRYLGLKSDSRTFFEMEREMASFIELAFRRWGFPNPHLIKVEIVPNECDPSSLVLFPKIGGVPWKALKFDVIGEGGNRGVTATYLPLFRDLVGIGRSQVEAASDLFRQGKSRGNV